MIVQKGARMLMNCNNCKNYDPNLTYEGMQWRNRGDGYCMISRGSTEGNVFIIVNDEDYCNLFKEKGEQHGII